MQGRGPGGRSIGGYVGGFPHGGHGPERWDITKHGLSGLSFLSRPQARSVLGLRESTEKGAAWLGPAGWLGTTSLGSPRHWPGLPTATAACAPCFEMSHPDLRRRPPHTPMSHLGPLATEHLCGHSPHLPRPAAWPAVAPAVWPSKQEGLLPPAGAQQKCQKTRVSGGCPWNKRRLVSFGRGRTLGEGKKKSMFAK